MARVAFGLLPVQLTELPGRLSTYSVEIKRRGIFVLVGYVRWCDDDTWNARDLGSLVDAAKLKKFQTQERATAWLQRRAEGKVIPGRKQ